MLICTILKKNLTKKDMKLSSLLSVKDIGREEKIMSNMKRFQVFKGKNIFNRIVLGGLCLFILGAVFYVALTQSDEDIKIALQNSAQLSITVALGIGALVIALNVKKEQKTVKLMQEMVIFMLLSILSFYLSFGFSDFIQRLYLVLSALIQMVIILEVYKVVSDKNYEK